MALSEHPTLAAGSGAETAEPGPWSTTRDPVQISDQVLRIDGRALEAYSRHIDDVLVAYIELVRGARRTEQPMRMTFRRMDIEVLAADLGCAPDHVIVHLAGLVGADAVHLARMQACFVSGESLIDSGVADVPGADTVEDDGHTE